MNRTELTSSLLDGLLELERSGEIVITSAAPSTVAEQLSSRIIQQWAREFLDEPPYEVVIDDGVKAAARYFISTFAIEVASAISKVEAFVGVLSEHRTLKEVAELIAHQGPQEIALGAYYCVHLQRGTYYSADYLDWRKQHYAQPNNSLKPTTES